MKKIISITIILSVVLSMFGAIAAFAATQGKCGDNAYWKLEDGVLTIWGKGEFRGATASNDVWSENRKAVKKLVIQEGITTIGAFTFRQLYNLETVIFPNSLEKIYADAFYECYNISYIDWGDWVDPPVLMYAADGRVAFVKKSEIEVEKTMGWSTERPIKLSDEEVLQGLKKGIDYLDKNLYNEAEKEFRQFSDANWHNMTKDQQKMVVDYVNKASFAIEANAKIPKAINYFNQGLYYEAINAFYGIDWDHLTKEQKDEVIDYIRKSKAKLADVSYNAGINYYNKGLYYEAQKEFTNAINMYTKSTSQWQSANDYLYTTNQKIADLSYNAGRNYYNKGLYYEAQKEFNNALNMYTKNTSQWQNANDYLYNTNERIKAWENRNTYTPSKSSSPSYYYNTFDNSSAPLYDSVTGKHRSGTSLMNSGGGWIYKYNYYSDQQKMIYDIGKYMDTLVDVGYVLIKEDSSSVLGWLNYDFRKGNERVYILIMANENKIHIQVYDK